jgi:hypothetical protein
MPPQRQATQGNPPTGNGWRVVLFSPTGIFISGLVALVFGGIFLLGYLIGGAGEMSRAKPLSPSPDQSNKGSNAHVGTGAIPSNTYSRPALTQGNKAGTMPSPTPMPQVVKTYEKTYEKSVFDSVPGERFDQLTPEQQWGFAKAEEDFNAYFQDVKRFGAPTIDDWNADVAEFHRDLVIRLGGETVDQLLKSLPRSVNPR